MTTLRDKALAHLRDGRVIITRAEGDPSMEGTPPTRIVAAVKSSRRDVTVPHFVDLDPNMGWYCTCRQGRDCAHIAAVQLVTGHPSAAAKED